MPDRLRVSQGCEDDAREALVRLAGSCGSTSLSLAWRRSAAAGLLITPVPRAGRAATPDDIAWIALQAESAPDDECASRPSAQWRLHRDIYRQRSDIGAIILSRPAYCTTLACTTRVQQEGIPAFHADVALAGGDTIVCVPYSPGQSPGESSTSSAPVIAALAGRAACLIAARGLLATGATLEAAAALCAEIEALAQIYWQALQIGQPASLALEETGQGPGAERRPLARAR